MLLAKCKKVILVMVVLLFQALAACGEANPTNVRPSPIATVPLATATPLPATAIPTLTPLPTLTPIPLPTATPQPTATPTLPPAPAFTSGSPDLLAQNIAGWLNKQADALPSKDPKTVENARSRLRTLLLNWKASGPEVPVEAVDLDGDGSPEIVASLAETWSESPSSEYGFLILLRNSNKVWFATTLRAVTLNPKAEEGFIRPALLKVADLRGDKQVEILFSEYFCSANTCTIRLHIVSWANNRFTNLTPDVPEMTAGQLSFEPTPGDATTTLKLSGGVLSSVGAGLQRERTEYWRWDATAKRFKLAETQYATSPYLYHRLIDGNVALDKGDYPAAISLYTEALTDSSLKLWFQQLQATPQEVEVERQTLTALTRFHLAIAYALNNEREKASATLQEAVTKDGKYGGWAKAFAGSYEANKAAKPNVAVTQGCQAAINFAQQNKGLLEVMNLFGYANPTFKPEDICRVL
ncbi:MAG: tetratricopeptide repeat protein [Chloroflexi bacterium]|nr:tetratricopeptide repeat protein [Chloroflexota bacterium]